MAEGRGVPGAGLSSASVHLLQFRFHRSADAKFLYLLELAIHRHHSTRRAILKFDLPKSELDVRLRVYLNHRLVSDPMPSPSILASMENSRVKATRPLIPPQILQEDLPLCVLLLQLSSLLTSPRTMAAAETVLEGRRGAEKILRGEDDRIIVVVGPCSVHNVPAALSYATLLKSYMSSPGVSDDLHIIMRVYFEKPRTTVGWKGLINDPLLNGSFQINKGLRLARGLLLDIAKMGVPAGCEFLDTISPQYTADLVAWGAIGARTTESQVHRELVSALSMPTGFKNSTDGGVGVAVDACRAAKEGHVFLSVGKEGLSSIIETQV